MTGLRCLCTGGGGAEAPCQRRGLAEALPMWEAAPERSKHWGCRCGKVRANAARWWRFRQWGSRIWRGDGGFSEVSLTSLRVRTLLSPPLTSSIFVALLNHIARVDGSRLRSAMLCGIELSSVGSYA